MVLAGDEFGALLDVALLGIVAPPLVAGMTPVVPKGLPYCDCCPESAAGVATAGFG